MRLLGPKAQKACERGRRKYIRANICGNMSSSSAKVRDVWQKTEILFTVCHLATVITLWRSVFESHSKNEVKMVRFSLSRMEKLLKKHLDHPVMGCHS